MALFDEGTTVVPARRRPVSRPLRVGVWALAVALVALLALTLLPTNYLIQRPGPLFDTLGTATAIAEIGASPAEGAFRRPAALRRCLPSVRTG